MDASCKLDDQCNQIQLPDVDHFDLMFHPTAVPDPKRLALTESNGKFISAVVSVTVAQWGFGAEEALGIRKRCLLMSIMNALCL